MSEKPYEKFIGKRFGKLTVLEFKSGNYKDGNRVRAKAKCLCDCGHIKWIDWGHLKGKTISSCGCLKDRLENENC